MWSLMQSWMRILPRRMLSLLVFPLSLCSGHPTPAQEASRLPHPKQETPDLPELQLLRRGMMHCVDSVANGACEADLPPREMRLSLAADVTPTTIPLPKFDKLSLPRGMSIAINRSLVVKWDLSQVFPTQTPRLNLYTLTLEAQSGSGWVWLSYHLGGH